MGQERDTNRNERKPNPEEGEITGFKRNSKKNIREITNSGVQVENGQNIVIDVPSDNIELPGVFVTEGGINEKALDLNVPSLFSNSDNNINYNINNLPPSSERPTSYDNFKDFVNSESKLPIKVSPIVNMPFETKGSINDVPVDKNDPRKGFENKDDKTLGVGLGIKFK